MHRILRNQGLLLALSTLLVTGCMTSGRSDDEAAAATAAGIIVPTQVSNQPNDDALMSGELVAVGKCLMVETNPGPFYLIVWPHGTTAAIVDGVIEVRDSNGDRKARVGEIVSLGGGEGVGSVAGCGGLFWYAEFQ